MNDIFNSNIFGITEMTAAITELPYVPTFLSGLGLFEEEGIRTLTALIEFQGNTLNLVPITPRNAPPASVPHDRTRVYPISIPHMPQSDGMLADAVQGVRAFGTETTFRTIEGERDKILLKMRRQIDYTIEAHRMAAIKGTFYDANGTSTDLFQLFGVSQSTVAMHLDDTTTDVRLRAQQIIDAVELALGGTVYNDIIVICGKNFWASLIDQKSVKDAYTFSLQAQILQSDPRAPFPFGGITFYRYRANSLVTVGDDVAYAIPRGVPGMYLTRFAPANYIETVNTIGLPYYAKSEPMPMGKGITMESQANAVNLVTRPAAVVKLLRVA